MRKREGGRERETCRDKINIERGIEQCREGKIERKGELDYYYTIFPEETSKYLLMTFRRD